MKHFSYIKATYLFLIVALIYLNICVYYTKHPSYSKNVDNVSVNYVQLEKLGFKNFDKTKDYCFKDTIISEIRGNWFYLSMTTTKIQKRDATYSIK